MVRRSALAGLLLLTLGPIPLVGWLGDRALRSLEDRYRELGRQETLAELAEELTDALARVEYGPDSPVLPLSCGPSAAPLGVTGEPTDPTEILLDPSGEALADPAAARARVLADEGRIGEALEAVQPLLNHADPRHRAVGYLAAADIMHASGKANRAGELAVRALAVLQGVDETAWTTWAEASRQLLAGDHESVLETVATWTDAVCARPTTVEELVLLGHLLGRLPDDDPHVTRLGEALAERRAWPEWRRLLLPRVVARLPGEDPALLPTPRGWFLVRDEPSPTACRIEGLDEWLEAWVGASGARARGAQEASLETISLSAQPGAGRWSVDVGDLEVEVTFVDAELFGAWNPRLLLFAGLAAYAGLAVLALRAFRSREHHATRLAQARGDLIAEVTHELRTPLTVLRLYAESLLGKRVPPDSEQEYLRTIAREAVRLGALVDRVADTARGEETAPAATEVLDPTPIVERVVHEFRPMVEADGGSITLAATGEVRLRGDREELRRILEILVDNARRYSLPPIRIEIATRVEGDRWVTTIRDHGPGIPVEERERVFERWVRGRAATGRGAGMGLYLARRGALALGGEVRLESPEDGGTRMRLELPCVDSAVQEGEA